MVIEKPPQPHAMQLRLQLFRRVSAGFPQFAEFPGRKE
jgi:hypothetical protein